MNSPRIPNLILHHLARTGAALLLAAQALPAARAEVRLNTLFSPHMVLQRGMKAPIWGTASPNEAITVSLLKGDGGEASDRVQKAATTTDADGHWRVALENLSAGGPYTLVVSGTDEHAALKVPDVMVGEVWLCSGQSNMEFALSRCIGGPEAAAASSNPSLRLFRVEHNDQERPQTDAPGKWEPSSPASTQYFSAVAYWFGSKLQKELGVPVGIINNSYGGTVIESWISQAGLAGSPVRDRNMDLAAIKADYEARVAKAKPTLEQYQKAKAEALAQHLPAPPMPSGLPGSLRGPTMLYNGETAPLIPYAIRGVVWYQGESNAYVKRADTYHALLTTLIQQWRKDWGEGDFPFIIVQLTPNRKPQTDPNENSGIAIVQEAQLKAAEELPHAALVTTMDLAETDVHYKRKEPAGERVMKAALAIAYGQPVEYCGPIYKAMTVAGSEAKIDFTHLDGGLKQGGPELKGFAVAGEDRKFVFAKAKIDGSQVVVSAPEVPEPVAVRYGWADYPDVNLFNQEGLPASPFRTDAW